MIELNPPIQLIETGLRDREQYPDIQPVVELPTDELYAPSGITDEVRDHRAGVTHTVELNNLQAIELIERLMYGSQGVMIKYGQNGTVTVLSKRPTELQAKYRQMLEDEYGPMQPVYSWQG